MATPLLVPSLSSSGSVLPIVIISPSVLGSASASVVGYVAGSTSASVVGSAVVGSASASVVGSAVVGTASGCAVVISSSVARGAVLKIIHCHSQS